jgi:hypothetical protein
MKCRVLKLAALALATVAGFFVVCWAASLANDPKTAQLAFGKEPSYVCLALGKGDLILCDHFDNREVIHLLDSLKPMQRGVSKEIRTALPGFAFRHLTLASGQRIWSLELSLLIPASLMGLCSGLSFRMMRKPGMACNLEPPNELTQRTTILSQGLHGA